jgi:hypothetical protein
MRRSTTANSTYPKGGVSCSKDSFVSNQTLVFQTKLIGETPAHRKTKEPFSFHRTDIVSNEKLILTNGKIILNYRCN